LNHGSIVEELSSQPPIFNENDELIPTKNNNRPARRTKFEKSTYKIDLTGFALNKSEEELFKNDFEMLNVFQLGYAIDSLQKKADNVTQNFVNTAKMEQITFQAEKYDQPDSITKLENKVKALPARVILWDTITKQQKLASISYAQSNLRSKLLNIESQKTFMGSIHDSVRNYKIESHRKFALTFAIIVLFFVGAPLGAIVRKGGFGAPVVIAALLFMVYFILISVGENLAKENVVSPFVGMWFATFILSPIAFILMRAAINDSPLFVMDNWIKFFGKFKKKKKDENPTASV